MVSASDIVRNADPEETRDVVIWVLVVAAVALVAVALVVVWGLVALARRVRRRRTNAAGR
jgi:heme/copper-type cytochrome/quinol oxidase subunit 2